MQVGQDDSDGVRPGEAEAARAGMRNVAELAHRIGDTGARLVADIVEIVERARNGSDGNLGASCNVTDGRFSHGLLMEKSFGKAIAIAFGVVHVTGYSLRQAGSSGEGEPPSLPTDEQGES